MSLKSTESELFLFLNKRFRVGWAIKDVNRFYNSLTEQEAMEEARKINDFCHSEILLYSKTSIEYNEKLKFTITGLAKKIYLSKEEIHSRQKQIDSYTTDQEDLLTFSGYGEGPLSPDVTTLTDDGFELDI